jgi:hypothetical protein
LQLIGNETFSIPDFKKQKMGVSFMQEEREEEGPGNQTQSSKVR